MRRLLASLLIWAAPSTPRHHRDRAALQSSAEGARGEAGPTPSAGSGSPEGGVLPVPRPPAHPELLLNWRPLPELRPFLTDGALAALLDDWSRGVGA